MAFDRFREGAEPVRGERVGRLHEEHQRRAGVFAIGSLACPRCDAPVSLGRALTPAEPLMCPFCFHDAAVKDFLSLATPARPAVVEVRVRRATPESPARGDR